MDNLHVLYWFKLLLLIAITQRNPMTQCVECEAQHLSSCLPTFYIMQAYWMTLLNVLDPLRPH